MNVVIELIYFIKLDFNLISN